MVKHKMYFGTKDRMTWIPCPAINAGLGSQRWIATGGFLNGGAYQRQSTIGARVFSFTWNPQEAEGLYELGGYFDGIHGPGPYYFIDPFAAKSNVLPASVASPVTMAGDAPTFGGTQQIASVLTGTNALGYPARSAQFAVGSSYGPYRSYTLPVPAGYSLHIGAHGSASGSASVVLGGGVGNAVLRTNRAPNGAFQSTSGTAVTAGTGGAASVSSFSPGRSGAALRATWTTASTAAGLITLSGTGFRVPVIPSVAYTYSVYVRPSSTLSLRLVSGAATVATGGTVTVSNGAYVTCPAGVWTRLTHTATQAGGFREMRVQSQGAIPVGTIDVDDLLVEEGSTVNPYFDGSYAFARWQGSAFASPSEYLAQNSTELPMMSVNDAQRTNTILPGGTWYDISVQGEGVLTLSGLIAQILPNGEMPELGNFIPGQGNTGVRLSGNPTVTGYSAALTNASVGMTAEFVETGAWEQ